MRKNLVMLFVVASAIAVFSTCQGPRAPRQTSPPLFAGEASASATPAVVSQPCQCATVPSSHPGVKLTVHRPGEPLPPAVPGVLQRSDATRFFFQLVRYNASPKPVQAVGGGRGGTLRIYRHVGGQNEELVQTLELPGVKDGGIWTCEPGGVFSNNEFEWPGAASAPPGDYVARADDVQLKFRLP